MLQRVDGTEGPRLRAAIAENMARRGGADTLVVSDYAPDHSLEGQSLAAIADREIDVASRSRRRR